MSLLAVSAQCVRLVNIGRALRAPLVRNRRAFATKYTECRNGYVPLEQAAERRRAQARRSVLVQVGSEASCGELVGYCEHFGQVEDVHHYTLDQGEKQHFMLVEFKSKSDADNILDSGSCHRKDVETIPMRTPFLWFKANGKNGKKVVKKKDFKLTTNNGCRELSDDEVVGRLQECEDISEQVQKLYDLISLNDLGVRLRYMVARQLEMAFENLHANIAVRPFGSSVNGFGKMGCDLDLVLTTSVEDESANPDRRLIFHTKKLSNGGAAQWKRRLELAGDVLHSCVPGCAHVRHILQARIPIIKYKHDLTGIECDLCATHMSGVYMSELLYLYGSFDTRVRPLVFAIRKWASTVGITNPSPGRWITNFPLTLMVIFFLQQNTKEGAILPSMKYLVDKAGKDDIRITDDQINCTFLRDLKKIPSEEFTQNTCNLESLLLQFYEFYAQFDFESNAISINQGRAIKKPSHCALYIVNPLEQGLNVSRNVSFEECERLKTGVRNAAWILESNLETRKKDSWGLIELIEKESNRRIKELVRVGNSHRLVSVADLFRDEEKNEPVEFKNKDVQNQVRRIKHETNLAVEEARRKMLRTGGEKMRQRTLRKR